MPRLQPQQTGTIGGSMSIAKLVGNTSKDSSYLNRIKDAIEHDRSHPRNLGVQMQAHHVISGEGMKRSRLGHKIEQAGYDINLLPNLAFIPCTLQGACHLGVQPHRGNHDFKIDQDDYKDDSEPPNYHNMVATMVQQLDRALHIACRGNDLHYRDKVIDALDALSKQILGNIRRKPEEAPLTRVALRFGKMGIGCGGVDSVRDHKLTGACAVGRNHFYRDEAPRLSQGPKQQVEKIRYQGKSPYKLEVGK